MDSPANPPVYFCPETMTLPDAEQSVRIGFTYPIGIRLSTLRTPPFNRIVIRSPSPSNGIKFSKVLSASVTTPRSPDNTSYFVTPEIYPTNPPVQLFTLDTPEIFST